MVLDATILSTALSQYLSKEQKSPTEAYDFFPIPGGASRQTWRFKAQSNGSDQGMVIRIDADSGLIDTDQLVEFRALEAAYRVGLPVPKPLFIDTSGEWLGRAFSITAEVAGCEASATFIPDEHRRAIGIQKYEHMGRLAALDPAITGLEGTFPATSRETCAMDELDKWEEVILHRSLSPNPIAHAALRWLRENPPPAAQKLSFVHGDFRTGNFLYQASGEVDAILDWEMAHFGDPLEDLSWSMDPVWSWQMQDFAGQLLPVEEAVEVWEGASGLKADPVALHWWRVFAAVKGLAIWLSAYHALHTGNDSGMILAVGGRLFTERQQRVLVKYLWPKYGSTLTDPMVGDYTPSKDYTIASRALTDAMMSSVPLIDNPFANTEAKLLVFLASMLGQDAERKAHVLRQEIQELREILGAAAQVAPREKLASTRITVEGMPESLELANLERVSSDLLDEFIRVHPVIEKAATECSDAAELNDRCQLFLADFAGNRAYDIAI